MSEQTKALAAHEVRILRRMVRGERELIASLEAKISEAQAEMRWRKGEIRKHEAEAYRIMVNNGLKEYDISN